MIQTFTVKNFKCIRETTINLAYAGKKAPNGWRNMPLLPFIENGKKRSNRICTVLALYGANASGKTTMLESVHFLTRIVLNGFNPLFYKPNRVISGEDTKPVSFSISFWKEKHNFIYTISYLITGITKEELSCDGKTLFSVNDGKLRFFFNSNETDIQRLFSTACVNAKTKKQVKTFLKEICKAFPGLNKQLLSAEEFLTSDIIFLGGTGVIYVEGVKYLASTYANNENGLDPEKEALKEISKFLQKLDVRIVDLKMDNSKKVSDVLDQLPPPVAQLFAQQGLGNEIFYSMQAIHKTDSNEKVYFPIEEESEGTRRLVGLLGVILAALRSGKVLMIDEIDQSLHSLLVMSIIKLFKEKRFNTNNAQLLCTIHNTDLLASRLLQLSEIGIVNQKGFAGSSILKLSSVKDLRNANDFRNRYLRGDFGGIPFPYF